jgi:hypothetical protein
MLNSDAEEHFENHGQAGVMKECQTAEVMQHNILELRQSEEAAVKKTIVDLNREKENLLNVATESE